jgi:FKBP-type peptidyl-prolyl cis-trans isomerase FkpA
MLFSNKLSLLCVAAALCFFSCNKTDDNTTRCAPVIAAAPSAEVSTLQAYLSANAISAVADSRGFFYIIHRDGDANRHPTVCSKIRISYTGRLTNGQQFDASASHDFVLGNLILGWQEGLPLIGEGGSITLYLPPSLGYGSQASGSIPANSILVFTIELLTIL